jgi:hypothetical protein
MSTSPTPERILQTGLAFWSARTLLSAIEVGVLRHLLEYAGNRSVSRWAKGDLRRRHSRDGEPQAFAAVPRGGALIVYESIIDDDRSKKAFGLMMSLNMLSETPGGFDDTGADCSGWMRDAGCTETRVEPLVGPDSMVIGIKSRRCV